MATIAWSGSLLMLGLLAAGCASTPSVPQGDARDEVAMLALAMVGDLLFFRDQERLSHVGIYLGDGRFVHAPSSGDSVRIARIDTPYYQRHLVAVGRLSGP